MDQIPKGQRPSEQPAVDTLGKVPDMNFYRKNPAVFELLLVRDKAKQMNEKMNILKKISATVSFSSYL